MFFPFAVAAALLCNCTFFPNSGNGQRELNITVSDQILTYDSVYIAVWNEQENTELQVLHTGKLYENQFQLSLDQNIPENYHIVLKGFSSDGEIFYHKTMVFKGNAFTDSLNVLNTTGVFSAGISPKSLTVSEGDDMAFTVQTTMAEPLTFSWYRNGEIIPGAGGSVLALDSATRDWNWCSIYALVGHATGYIFTDTALLLVTADSAYNPESPYPVDGSTGLPLFLELSWSEVRTAPEDTALYDIRMETYPDSTPDVYLSRGQPETRFSVTNLEDNMTYYWQVIARVGPDSVPGRIWRFTTRTSAGVDSFNVAPDFPKNPLPVNNATGVSATSPQLSWTVSDPNAGDIIVCDVYLSTETPPTTKVATGLQQTSFTPEPLQEHTTYFWQVVASDSLATTSGPIWTFSTGTAPTFHLTTPNGGETWEAGSQQSITWTLSGNVDTVILEYTSGNQWILINTTANNGNYIWTVPAIPSSTMKVRVRDVGNTVWDESDDVFTIVVAGEFDRWRYNSRILLNTTDSGAGVMNPVTDFPVLLRLNSGNFNFSQATNDGSDIRFSKTDRSTHLFYEIELWDSRNQQAVIWVKVDTVYGNDSSQFFYIYWDNIDALDNSDGALVFDTDDGFAGVWHLDEEITGKGADSAYRDATANANHGIDVIDETDRQGVIGRGHGFGTQDDHIFIGTFDPSASDLTLSLWVNWGGDDGTDAAMIAKRSSWGIGSMRWQLIRSNSSNNLAFETAGSRAQFNTDFPATNQWIHVALVYTGLDNSAKLFFNGVQTGGTQTMEWGPKTDADLRIGATDNYGDGFNGSLDEVRISSSARSPDWIKLSWENQKPGQTLVTIIP
jgi:hypothetical protein